MRRLFIILIVLALSMPCYAQTESAHFKLNDTTGTTIDDTSSNNNDGTASTDASDLTAVGKVNNCLNFVRANSEYVDITDVWSAVSSDTQGTVSLWFRTPDVTPASAAMILVSFGDPDGTSDYFNIQVPPTQSRVTTIVIGDNGYFIINSTISSISDNTWHHVALVQDGVEAALYLDGSKDTVWSSNNNRTVWFSSMTSATNGDIARWRYNNNGGGYYHDGDIDDVRVYSEALSADDIATIYNAGSGTEDSLGGAGTPVKGVDVVGVTIPGGITFN